MYSPADIVEIPFADWVENFVRGFVVPTFRPIFRAAQAPVHWVMQNLDAFLNGVPMVVFTACPCGACLAGGGQRCGALHASGPELHRHDRAVGRETMTTLSMIITAVVFCIVLGVPLGIAAARSDRFLRVLRPVLDIMQTIPSFVYLVPIVMLFGVGNVPGVIATIIFAMPPIIRLTNLGIRNVRGDLIEAAKAFGSTPRQILFEVQLPLALRTIMAGLNQTLMLALSMVVIAALIGAGGLGLTVNTGLGRLDVGTATAGGVGIVLLAIILDRITQGLGEKKPRTEKSSVRDTISKIVKPMVGGARSAEPAE